MAKKILAVILLLVLLSGCIKVNEDGTVVGTNYKSVVPGIGLYKFVDKDNGVTCYFGSSYGLSCVVVGNK